jgi:spore coat polysaccharide biosynthesis protein SpsF
MKEKIVCIIQARTGSTRFPSKVLYKIGDRSILSFVIRRVALSKGVNRSIVVATTNKAEDDVIATMTQSEGVGLYRGSESDVLDRYYQAAVESQADVVIRVTSDCPLIDYEVIDRVTAHFLEAKNVDYASNRIAPSYPQGLDAEIFTVDALRQAWRESRLAYDREHVTPYLYHSGKFRLLNIPYETDISYLNLSVDYEKDYRFLFELYRHLKGEKDRFTLSDILSALMAQPELLKISQKDGVYEKFLSYAREMRRIA